MMLPQLFDLTDRVAIVTGATGLLGRQHCAALAQAGARVVAADCVEPSTHFLADELMDRYRPTAMGAYLDVAVPESIDALRDQVLERFGQIDILINNAAIDDKVDPAAGPDSSRFERYPLERFQREIGVNLTGVFLCCQRLGGPMAERRRGSIVNIASTYGLVAPRQSLYITPEGVQSSYKGPAYPVSKAGVIHLTRYLAAYWGARQVRVNTLCPGGVAAGQPEWFQATYAEQTALGRMASPLDYHGAIVFLASDASSYMTGAILVVDGGYVRC